MLHNIGSDILLWDWSLVGQPSLCTGTDFEQITAQRLAEYQLAMRQSLDGGYDSPDLCMLNSFPKPAECCVKEDPACMDNQLTLLTENSQS